MNRIITIIIALFLVCFDSSVLAQKSKYEVRAVWLTTIGGLDWPHRYARSASSIEAQKQELIQILDKLQDAGINTVLLQTRIRGTVIYPSRYEPWDGCVSGIPGLSPGYDPLQFAIEECHKRGMELQAWIVTIPVGKWNGTGIKNLRSKRVTSLKKIGDEGYMNPEDTRTAIYLSKICGEIVDNYDVDGIHLDYIRYPETWNIKVSKDQARRHITDIVNSIHQTVKSKKPWVKLSCSPVGKADDLTRYESYGWNAYNKVCQDAQGWLRNGLMDELFPMMYFRGNQFYPFAIDWAEQSNGRIIVPGLGIYFMSPKEKNWDSNVIEREMHVLRSYNLGYAFFRSKFFTDNLKGIYDFTVKFNQHPTLVPPMTWASNHIPTAPENLRLEKQTLKWEKENNTYYNIYSSDTWPVDISDGNNLIAAKVGSDHLEIDNPDMYYAVTAMNRYGTESQPSTVGQASPKQTVNVSLPCNGQKVTIPTSYLQDEPSFTVAITSLTGVLLSTAHVSNNSVDVRQLANGSYILRTLSANGQSHRIGYFTIKR
uniref:Family 10 glycosylhydrolase n=1 Tax=Prevotella sp. GTC17262 TaxID=3236797 RepID=A0AB33JG24_9BACT